MLRNPKGATSLRWLQVLLDGGIEVHGQVVVCPGVNDGAALEDTLAGILDRYPQLASVGAVPLGVSRYSNEPDMRPHTLDEAVGVVETIEQWQAVYRQALGRRMVFAADEYYLLAGRDFPAARQYEGLPPARERDRHGALVRRLVRPSRRRGPGGRAPRLLRVGRRRAGGGLPGAAPALGAGGERRPAGDGADGDVRVARCSNRWWLRTVDPTWRCTRWRTTSSAATSAWRGC